nr:FAD-dependent oxidoreductase [Ornithinimicrobium sp. HY1745]
MTEDTPTYDVIVVGAGSAGIPCALAAARAGARVLLVEKDRQVGGTLHLSGGHLSAAGTRRQKERGIEDSHAEHLADIMRISDGSVRDDLATICVEHATETVDWLDDQGFDFAPETPRIVYGHEPYHVPRTYYGVDGALSVLAVLRPALDEAVNSGAVELWTDSPLIELHRSHEGSVEEVTVIRKGTDTRVRARHGVVLATGGFASNAEMFEEIEKAPLVSAAHPTSTGDGLFLAREIGAGMQGLGYHMPTFGGLPSATSPGRANWADRPLLIAAERPPVEIYVDQGGSRWVAEDEESIDLKERALATLPDQTFWMIFDDAMLEATRETRPLVVGWSVEDVRERANVRPGVHSAATVEELAQVAGIDAEGLSETIRTYSEAVALGRDDLHGRTHLPMPFGSGPFYALRNHAIALVTFAGIDVDTDLAVRTEDGQPIPGLYAAGEVIGAAATCGRSFCSGMLMTPALTLGRLLGERLGAASSGRD